MGADNLFFYDWVFVYNVVVIALRLIIRLSIAFKLLNNPVCEQAPFRSHKRYNIANARLLILFHDDHISGGKCRLHAVGQDGIACPAKQLRSSAVTALSLKDKKENEEEQKRCNPGNRQFSDCYPHVDHK